MGQPKKGPAFLFHTPTTFPCTPGLRAEPASPTPHPHTLISHLTPPTCRLVVVYMARNQASMTTTSTPLMRCRRKRPDLGAGGGRRRIVRTLEVARLHVILRANLSQSSFQAYLQSAMPMAKRCSPRHLPPDTFPP